MRFRGKVINGEAVAGKVVVRFSVAQIVDSRQAETAANEMRNAMVQSRSHTLIVDFTSVNHMTSVMLGKLMLVRKGVLEAKGSMRVCGLSPQLTQLFKISGFRKIFDVYATLEEAMKD